MKLPDTTIWMDTDHSPALSGHNLHIWKLDLGKPTSQPSLGLLCADERQRAQRFKDTTDANRFITARGSMRRILAGYLDTPPGELQFNYGPKGKPALASPHTWLQFNLSHCRDFALLAVNRAAPLGIDLEQVKPGARLPDIARRLFKDPRLSNSEPTTGDTWLQLFYEHWTSMEARLKAQGLGVFDQAQDVASKRLHIRHFIPHPGYLAALAMPHDPGPVAGWHCMVMSPSILC